MHRRWLTALLFFVIGHFVDIHGQDLLKTSDINHVMQLILREHVDKKEVTSQLVQHALMVYVNQFDPHRMYLLESEVAPFSHLSSEEMERAIKQYQSQDFALFTQLNQVIQSAIERSRAMRRALESDTNSTLFYSAYSSSEIPETDAFPATTEELKKRLIQNERAFIDAQRRRYGNALTPKKKEQILRSYEAQLREFENHYLYQDEQGAPLPPSEQENLFAIHVLKALSKSLDAHTSFYQSNEAYDLRLRLQKEFRGIGLILKDTSDGIIVSHLFEGGPAARSKQIQTGDRLLKVDNRPTERLSFEEVMDLLHGEKDTPLQLLFERRGKNGEPNLEYSVALKRETIILNNNRVDVSTEEFGNGIIAKITLHSFYQGHGVSSEKDVRDALEKLEGEGNLRGVILDLRDNSGGFLSQAVKVAGLFITNGVVVISKYGNGEERIYRDMDGKTTYTGPLIVLTSKATASAAEIVAQALQDYGVALVVGDEHTYGKGTIQAQTVTDNQSASYFKVTVGTYYTVSGNTPQKQGVTADIVVPGHWNGEQIGEMYAVDALDAGKILPLYDDPLKDVSPDVRLWYLKYYIPTLQHRTTAWRNFLPALKKNSAYRIAHNKNYQFFLKGSPEEEEQEEGEEEGLAVAKPKSYGEDDLQMEETVNILKDMIYMDSLKKK